MSLNHYWEKYRNRNKSHELVYPQNEKPVPNSIVLDHISQLQSQINQIETKLLDLNCKFNSISAYENKVLVQHDPIMEKVERIEKSLEFKTEIETRFRAHKESERNLNHESMKSDILKEIYQAESRIAMTLSKEVQELNNRIRDINDSVKEQKSKSKTQEHQTESKDLQDWQKRIEKIVINCAEKLKKSEDQNPKLQIHSEILEQIQADLKRFKSFQVKVKDKLTEIEDFSKKICRKMIESEISSINNSPNSKKSKLESSLCSTQKKVKVSQSISEKPRKVYSGYSSVKKIKDKKESFGTPSHKDKVKGLNKLEKLYNELNDL